MPVYLAATLSTIPDTLTFDRGIVGTVLAVLVDAATADGDADDDGFAGVAEIDGAAAVAAAGDDSTPATNWTMYCVALKQVYGPLAVLAVLVSDADKTFAMSVSPAWKEKRKSCELNVLYV